MTSTQRTRPLSNRDDAAPRSAGNGPAAWDGYFLSSLGCLAWLEGRQDDARGLADELDATANEHEWPIVTRIRRVLRAMILLADRDYAAAEQCLEAALADQQRVRDSAIFAGTDC